MSQREIEELQARIAEVRARKAEAVSDHAFIGLSNEERALERRIEAIHAADAKAAARKPEPVPGDATQGLVSQFGGPPDAMDEAKARIRARYHAAGQRLDLPPLGGTYEFPDGTIYVDDGSDLDGW